MSGLLKQQEFICADDLGGRTCLEELFGLCNGVQDTEFLPERRSLRIHGHSTTIRLERAFWNVLEELAASEGMTVVVLVTKIHDHCKFANQKNGNTGTSRRSDN